MKSKNESFFVIDTETMGIDDKSIVLDLSMAFVNMKDLYRAHYENDNFNPITFGNFINSPFVKKLSQFPNIKEQRELGSTYSKDTLQFWAKQKFETKDDDYRKYIEHIFSNEEKDSVSEVVKNTENFIQECFNSIESEDAPFLERSGGFDTNKYYNLMGLMNIPNTKSLMKYWARREIRTIISCNRYRIDERYLIPNTTSWNKSLRNLLNEEAGSEFTQHVAINDCLIDAYMIYLFKMTIDNFYI